MSDSWENWLNSEDCLRILGKCAKDIYSSKEYRDLIEKTDTAVDLDDLRNVLWEFLKTNENLQADLSQIIIRGDITTFRNRIKYAFLNECRDKLRKIDPFRKIYREMRRTLQVFSKENPTRINYEPRRNETYYAFSSARNLPIAPINIWSEHAENNFKDWALPDDKFGPLDIEDGKNKIILAQFFWEEALRFFHQEYLVPVRELVRYIFSKFNLMGPVIKPPPPVLPVDSPIDPKDLTLFSRAEIIKITKELESLAENIVRAWDDDEKMVFILKYDEDQTIEEIEKGGYKSVQYKIKKANNLIAQHFNSWLPIDFLDHYDFFRKFLDEKIIYFAKTTCGTVNH